MDADGFLHWPVLFVYPEYAQTDFIEEFSETTCLLHQLEVWARLEPLISSGAESLLCQVMFPEEERPSTAWDIRSQYK